MRDTPAAAPSGRRRWLYLLPVGVFLVLAGIFALQLADPPGQVLPSELIDRPVPEFALEPLPGRGRPLTSEHLKGEVSLVNIFGSWCVACVQEHPFLVDIKNTGDVPIHGIDWNERNPEDGMKWLQRFGDPYDRAGLDPDSEVAIAFGVTGAPETFVVDRNGVIRYKHSGPITPTVWSKTLKPLIEDLRRQ
ncbi:DsbE family thiol:disulfide interchange protein [Roseospirillum parvum]|uniref:Cytochrome c biogenesis protein CcmG, thiol:disulfide interchange protein DsbE n=1 Tax=Roseospirillum parvum TaxID=83401 RepID=A0A1G8C3E5_9PROT|nr:DsbE family thiol:disulfide interchange protein [Roseospirillum parvum]SDH40021.1 cytochrome c biogenesis protein CcmG, thiol:disulfide interchange protein DsbE [Roseospirillum parvum]